MLGSKIKLMYNTLYTDLVGYRKHNIHVRKHIGAKPAPGHIQLLEVTSKCRSQETLQADDNYVHRDSKNTNAVFL